MLGIKRRDFIALLGGGAAPLVLGSHTVHAQQRAMPTIGVLEIISPEVAADRMRAFRQGLMETGYVEGENVAIEYRWAENQVDRMPALAADLVRRRVSLIAATGPIAASAAQAATKDIPIVFRVGSDPVAFGFVASLAHPGGNLTGVNFFAGELTAKRLGLLRELLPGAARVAVLIDPRFSTSSTMREDAERAARALGLQTRILNASTSVEIDAAFVALAHDKPDALLVGTSAFFTNRRVQLANLASHYSIPMSSATRETAEAGGLMSYGTSLPEGYRQIGIQPAES